ncbi:hypothetical protein BD779DRAFT_606449 [Infundibulicybe gibba]|nr:hypothetical protein BD779DRAFT_606449 [Infundibulicybe gibba]
MVSPRQGLQTLLAFALVAGALNLLYIYLEPTAQALGFSKNSIGAHEAGPPDESHQADLKEWSNETTIPGPRTHGFTIFDQLYLRGGVFYVVTSEPTNFPPRGHILSRPIDRTQGADTEPTDADLRFVSPAEAWPILGDRAILVEEMSMIMQDTPQFMHHYYHWWGEIILGAYRVYSAVPTTGGPLPSPARFILPHSGDLEWKDRAGVDGPLMRAAFPSTAIETSSYWGDLQQLNQTFVFQRAMIINRSAAHRSPLANMWYKMISSTMNVTAPDRFWEAVRKPMLENVLGYIPLLNDHGAVVSPPQLVSDKPIVTYISRQGGGRRLRDEDHQALVAALEDLEAEGVCEVHVVRMELMTLKQQLDMASRSTIMLGVHGNGLTHTIWMPPSPRSTVFEIFIPEGYLFDYEMLARNMGHRHYAVWNDTFATYPKGAYHKGVKYPEGFHGNQIPVFGPAIALRIRERLVGPIVK